MSSSLQNKILDSRSGLGRQLGALSESGDEDEEQKAEFRSSGAFSLELQTEDMSMVGHSHSGRKCRSLSKLLLAPRAGFCNQPRGPVLPDGYWVLGL